MTGKERAAFRAQANTLEPLFQIGKGCVNATHRIDQTVFHSLLALNDRAYVCGDHVRAHHQRMDLVLLGA